MKRLSIIITSFVVCLSACTQAPGNLFRIERNHMYGYIDSLGTEVIPPQYIIAGHFRNGLACVVTDTSFIHDAETLKLQGEPFIIKKDTVIITYGYINTKNDFVIKPQLKLRIAQENSFLSKFNQGDDPLSAKGIRSYVEKNLYFPADGLAMFQSTEGKYGFIDKSGKVVIDPMYSEAKLFSEGKAAVRIDKRKPIGEKKEIFITERLWGCIDTKGNKVIDFIFKSIEPFHNNRSFVELDATVERNSDIAGEYIKDKDGNWAVDTTKAITGTEIRRTPVTNKYLIDEKGNIISEPLGNVYVYGTYSKNGLCYVNPSVFGSAFGMSAFYMDMQGNHLEPGGNLTEIEIRNELSKPHIIDLLPEDAIITECWRFVSGYAPISAGEDKWLFVDKNLFICGKDEANWLYEDAYPFSSGFAAVKLNGKYGFIDTNFNLVIPCQFDYVDYFNGPLAFVTNSKEGVTISSYINRNGKIVWQNIEKDLE